MTQQAGTEEPKPPGARGDGAKTALSVVAVLGLAALAFLGVREGQRARLVPDGAAPPDFQLRKHEGGSLALTDLKGQVVMLDFWATWCPPCREEMPSLVKLAKEYESQGLVFVAASRDEGATAEQEVDYFLRRFQPELKPYVVYADDDVARAFQVNALPTLYFLDRDGKVTDAQRGMLSEDGLRRRIERALKK
ncbi:TlpA family protein disulfide reductase [Corallococcus praedator]|uniref:TlpA family protein disulfide reductase n=1 Tax=Corallococcus praedator TaxID=2316724 RepID=A0ABX9QFK5_9BACT|nr:MULTISPECIES: TlpA disulfide reductase family protein [Corallococcus]RKH07973.1 TlpA family protein disulfide reductase [Corallococcus sp. CA047B]RKH29887.1 TlpA family protein disulfide reductase [Corallococcus sp. CA031C]RKI06192.1 TlpA family protein disulfide reductase [Corallococcus praedator]